MQEDISGSRQGSTCGGHTIAAVTSETSAPGCRDLAVITGILVAAAIALVAIGLGAINRESCTGLCETAGLTALYAGGPLSALLGVAFGGVHLAWPLDITFWVALGFGAARWVGNRGKNPGRFALGIIGVALLYGLVLSQLVELDIPG